MGWESSDVVRFDLEPLLQDQTSTANLKVLITRILLILEDFNVKPTCRISWALESSDVVRFDLWPLLQGQTMVHWLCLVVFPVDTDLYRFSDA